MYCIHVNVKVYGTLGISCVKGDSPRYGENDVECTGGVLNSVRCLSLQSDEGLQRPLKVKGVLQSKWRLALLIVDPLILPFALVTLLTF